MRRIVVVLVQIFIPRRGLIFVELVDDMAKEVTTKCNNRVLSYFETDIAFQIISRAVRALT
ncbi:hypothetical protein PanWU01x14_092120 [Parasponia andersonii]|uniref:Uncharacterized protein n=1 Tax=Parasponia andersonii TaxID=3476 RepID=A0A2P5D6H6_PARAD|nr:hypothetical protein PanWU01x14_092120 [Parasponia andersonii]